MFKPEIAIIIPTIDRDDLLISTIHNVVDYYQENWQIFIIDQNKEENYSEDKTLLYNTIASQFHHPDNRRIEIIKVPYDSGLSHCRNVGVKRAMEKGIPYCLISADSIKFKKSMRNISELLRYFNRYDLIGLDIENRLKWEAKIRLIEGKSFELDFIQTSCKNCSSKKLIIYNCDICRNFFLAKTETLLELPWDENLKMHEHEDFFYRYSTIFKVGYTNHFKGEYVGEKSKKDGSPYSKLRQKNMRESLEVLRKKYNISGWVTYKNLERIKK